MSVNILPPDEINIVSLGNIHKFFQDHPELDKKEFEERISEEHKKHPRECCITVRGGVIFGGRESIKRLLGNHAEDFFKEVASSEEHINMAVKNIEEYDASLK